MHLKFRSQTFYHLLLTSVVSIVLISAFAFAPKLQRFVSLSQLSFTHLLCFVPRHTQPLASNIIRRRRVFRRTATSLVHCRSHRLFFCEPYSNLHHPLNTSITGFSKMHHLPSQPGQKLLPGSLLTFVSPIISTWPPSS